MTFYKTMIKFHERRAKTMALTQLRGLSERQLIDCNISPELLSKGLKGWPWRNHLEVTIGSAMPVSNQKASLVHRNESNGLTKSDVGIRTDRSEAIDTVVTRKTVLPTLTDKAA